MQKLISAKALCAALLSAAIASSAIASSALAHDQSHTPNVPGLLPLQTDRQIAFNKHWLLGCGTDVIVGVDKCKAQTFDFGPKTKGKAKLKHTLQISSWEHSPGKAGYNLNFRSTIAEIDFQKPMALSFDYGPAIELSGPAAMRPAKLRNGTAMLDLAYAPENIIDKLKRSNNVRVFYFSIDGAKHSPQFSLLGFTKTFNALNDQEQSPRPSPALIQQTAAQNKLLGTWAKGSTKLNINRPKIDRTEGRTTYFHWRNPTGGGMSYASIVFGQTSAQTIKDMAWRYGIVWPQLDRALDQLLGGQPSTAAALVHTATSLFLVGQINEAQAFNLHITSGGKVQFTTLNKVDEPTDALVSPRS